MSFNQKPPALLSIVQNEDVSKQAGIILSRSPSLSPSDISPTSSKVFNPVRSCSEHQLKAESSLSRAVSLNIQNDPPSSPFDELVQNSLLFQTHVCPMPTRDNQLASLGMKNTSYKAWIGWHSSECYPVAHCNVKKLLSAYLNFQKQHGEQLCVYSPLSLEGFIDRLFKNRPVVFVGREDSWRLRNGQHGRGGFETIGSVVAEKPPLVLRDYISYDEMALSALLLASSPTYFVNNGERRNKGVACTDGNCYEMEGICVGLAAARFERPGFMEWKYMIVSRDECTSTSYYGLLYTSPLLQLWAQFYGLARFPSFDEARSGSCTDFCLIREGLYFNIKVYKKRLAYCIEPFLLEANQRAQRQGKGAYCHIIGLGLGRWKIAPEQQNWMLEVYAELISNLDLKCVSDIDFSYFKSPAQCGTATRTGQQLTDVTGHRITIHFSKRNMADPLRDAKKLLVVMVPRDCNAFPGNDYWVGKLDESGEAAAACCSTIAELQNPIINPRIGGQCMRWLGQYEFQGKLRPTPKESLPAAFPGYLASASPESAELLAIFQQLVQKSRQFQSQCARILTNDNQIQVLGDSHEKMARIAAHATQTRPIAHSKVLDLAQGFLSLYQPQIPYGNKVQKALFTGMSVETFIDRLLTKRPITFIERCDAWMLRDGQQGVGGFDAIGTSENEVPPLLLRDYISYNEMAISALLGVSVPTYFINNGSRNNQGIASRHPTSFEPEGVYVGLVGARFEHPGQMEYRHMVVTKKDCTDSKHYSLPYDHPLLLIWAKFYGIERFPSFEEAKRGSKANYFALDSESFLNIKVYKQRMAYSIEPFLLDANQRAQQQQKSAYCHMVGLGLGVWMVSDEQAQWFMDAVAELLPLLELPNVSDIDFSYFDEIYKCGKAKNGDHLTDKAGHPITIRYSKRNPADPLKDSRKLLVAMYAWDSNAYPGNEYWQGSFAASGDPAAACCSTILELQNPLINDRVSGRHMCWLGTCMLGGSAVSGGGGGGYGGMPPQAAASAAAGFMPRIHGRRSSCPAINAPLPNTELAPESILVDHGSLPPLAGVLNDVAEEPLCAALTKWANFAYCCFDTGTHRWVQTMVDGNALRTLLPTAESYQRHFSSRALAANVVDRLAALGMLLDINNVFSVVQWGLSAPNRSRTVLAPILPFLRLVVSALRSLPSAGGQELVYCGEPCVHPHFSTQFIVGQTFALSSLTRATYDMGHLAGQEYCGPAGPRTCYFLNLPTSALGTYDVKQFSRYPQECHVDVLLEPGMVFRVTSVTDYSEVPSGSSMSREQRDLRIVEATRVGSTFRMLEK